MAKPMRLITEAEYNKLTELRRRTLPYVGKDSTYFDKKNQAQEILYKNHLPDDIKLELFSNCMKSATKSLSDLLEKPINIQKVREKLNKQTNALKLPDQLEEETEIDSTIISQLPSSIQNKARIILTAFRKQPNLISWNQDAIIYFQGKEEPGSNMVDILQYMTRTLKKMTPPIGINRCLMIAKVCNVPTSILAPHLREDFKGTEDNIRPKSSVTGSASKMPIFTEMVKNYSEGSKNQKISTASDLVSNLFQRGNWKALYERDSLENHDETKKDNVDEDETFHDVNEEEDKNLIRKDKSVVR